METLTKVTGEGTDQKTVQNYVDLLSGHYSVVDLPGLKFAKKIADNIDAMEERLAPLNEILQPTKEFEEFAERVREEAGTDAEKIKLLEEENKELVDHRKSQLETAEEMLKENMSITLRTIYEGELPNNISAKQIKALKSILK
jgi:ribosome biogenesis GTPase A